MGVHQPLPARRRLHDSKALVALAAALLPIVGLALSADEAPLARAERYGWMIPTLTTAAVFAFLVVAALLARPATPHSTVFVLSFVGGVLSGSVPGNGLIAGNAAMAYWFAVGVAFVLAVFSAFDAAESPGRAAGRR